ncbi:zinc finger, CCHC-type containing protein [Tanacetum coccineum]
MQDKRSTITQKDSRTRKEASTINDQERFNTTSGNLVKEILLKLNLPDHKSILTDSKEYIKMDIERRSVKVKELQERCNVKAFQVDKSRKGINTEVLIKERGRLSKMTEEDALLAFKYECGNVESSKELWDSLEAKYMAEEASSKKFLVSCIIDKLPFSWKDFKHTLKHLKEELTLVELGSHLRIEEPFRMQDNDKSKGSNVAGPYYLCDLNVILSLGNKKYFVTFIDDASRFCYVSLLHTKDEALDKLKVFKTEVKLHQRSLIKRFRTDRGGEYMDTLYFQSVGIIHETTAPYTPQQNGISERKNRVLKEMVNSMLSYSGLSQGFWGEAMLTACYLLNRVPNKRNMITPYELWTKRKPNLNYLRVWGCRAVVRLPDPKLKTLGERGIECIFVGYAEHSKAFRFYVIEPNDSVSINSIIESKDAIFDENRFLLVPRPSQRSLVNGIEDIGCSVVPEEIIEEVVQQPELELRKSKKNRTPKAFEPEFQSYLI